MCTGDPCVWSAVVHTQENIFISTYTRGVQAWVDHERSCDNLFTARTCTDLQISSKRLSPELWLRTDSKQQKKWQLKKLASHFNRVSLWYLDVAMSSLMSPIHIPLGSPNHKLTTTTTTTTTATASTRSWMRPKCRTREIWKDPTEKKQQKGHSMGASLEKTRVKSMSQSTGFHCWVHPPGWLRWWIHEGFHFSRFTNFPTLWEGIGWDMVRCWGLRSLFLVHRFASQSRIKIPPKPTCARSTLTPHKCYNWIPVILPSPMKRVNFTRHLKYTLNLKMQGKYQRNKKYFIT